MKYIFTYNKICFYLLILLVVFKYFITLNTGLYVVFCGIVIFFIQNRISEMRQIIGITNSVLYNYLNIHPSKSLVSSKTNDYKIAKESIRCEITSINKLSLIDNNFSHLVHLVYCYYDELHCSTKSNQVKFNFEDIRGIFDYHPSDSNNKSSAKIKFNFKLIKEIVKIF